MIVESNRRRADMAGLIRLLMLLFIGRQAYERTKAQGAWSWKLFFLVLLAVAVVCGASIPLFIVSGNALGAGHTFVGAPASSVRHCS